MSWLKKIRDRGFDWFYKKLYPHIKDDFKDSSDLPGMIQEPHLNPCGGIREYAAFNEQWDNTGKIIPESHIDYSQPVMDYAGYHSISLEQAQEVLNMFGDGGIDIYAPTSSLPGPSHWTFCTNFVYVDEMSPFSGTEFPAGTRSCPVNNLADAELIAEKHNLEIFDNKEWNAVPVNLPTRSFIRKFGPDYKQSETLDQLKDEEERKKYPDFYRFLESDRVPDGLLHPLNLAQTLSGVDSDPLTPEIGGGLSLTTIGPPASIDLFNDAVIQQETNPTVAPESPYSVLIPEGSTVHPSFYFSSDPDVGISPPGDLTNISIGGNLVASDDVVSIEADEINSPSPAEENTSDLVIYDEVDFIEDSAAPKRKRSKIILDRMKDKYEDKK